MLRRMYSAGIASLMLFGVVVPQLRATDVPIKPNEDVQSFMRTWCSPNLEERRELFPDETTESELRAKLLELQEKAGGPKKLVEQLLYFRVHAKNTREAMMPVVAMEQLGISADDKVSAILPSLEVDDEPALSEAYEWLAGVDYDRETKRYDFTRYERVLRERRSTVPHGLARYMYSTAPDTALSTFAAAYLDKDEAQSLVDQVTSESDAKAVDRLSRRPEWWAGLYAAEKMKQNPKLNDAKVIGRLMKSKHAVVREAVQEIEGEEM